VTDTGRSARTLHSKATRITYNAHTVRLLKAGVVRWRAQESKADGPRLMAWARFKHRSTGKRFFFASVHLETASKRVRKKQWKQLLRVVPKLAHGLPVVVAGDFNSTRNQKGNAAERFLPKMKKAGFGDTLGQTSRGNLKVTHARPHRADPRELQLGELLPPQARPLVEQELRGPGRRLHLREQPAQGAGVGAGGRPGAGGQKLEGVIPSDHNLIRANLVIKR
jgi:hypothetical protein